MSLSRSIAYKNKNILLELSYLILFFYVVQVDVQDEDVPLHLLIQYGGPWADIYANQ